MLKELTFQNKSNQDMELHYPALIVDLEAYKENIRILQHFLKSKGLSFTAVTKSFCAFEPLVDSLKAQQVDFLADSRIENLASIGSSDIPRIMLCLPALSRMDAVVEACEIVQVSELKAIEALGLSAKKHQKTMGVVLMMELGDLREGALESEIDLLAKSVIESDFLELKGLAANFSCFAGILPDEENLSVLVKTKEMIETKYGISLDLCSGGNSSSLLLAQDNRIPKGVNNLRLGESVALGRETAKGENFLNLRTDVFSLAAELIEYKVKPSMPWGESGMDAFGRKKTFKDEGLQRRGILSIGLQDVNPEDLKPMDPDVRILGSSSDHLLLDLSACESRYSLGDVLYFALNYSSLLKLSTSSYVSKVCKDQSRFI